MKGRVVVITVVCAAAFVLGFFFHRYAELKLPFRAPERIPIYIVEEHQHVVVSHKALSSSPFVFNEQLL